MLDKFLTLVVILILTGPVLLVDVLLGDRSLHNAWIIALVGFGCYALLAWRQGKR